MDHIGDLRNEIAGILSKQVKMKEKEIIGLLETPPDHAMGDFAFPCFSLSKKLKKSPKDIALDISKKIKPKGLIVKIEPKGPYVNFFVYWGKLGNEVFKEILGKMDKYGSSDAGRKRKALVEYPGPNTNKPLHLGHLRNLSLGDSLTRILLSLGYDARRVNINNDRGVHICKSMLAYMKWPRQLDKKPDHFVGDYYALFGEKAKKDASLEEGAKEMLRKWESGDKETVDLWKKMNSWFYEGAEKTYANFGVLPGKEYYESETYMKGKEMVMEGVDKGLFRKDRTGAVIFDMRKQGLDEKVLIRSDGTAVYMTQDIYLAKKRYEDNKFDRMIYVVANEQDYHFDVLFKVMEAMKLPFAGKCHHLSYGMVDLPSGRMKSREGTVVDADDLINEMEALAAKEVSKRDEKIAEKELSERSHKIALAAIKYFLLKTGTTKNIMFNPEESISFDGDTGPYLQYTYARARSILGKHGKELKSYDATLLKHPMETRIIRLVAEFAERAAKAGEDMRPHYMANYVYDLATAFNEFYQFMPVLKAPAGEKEARLALVKAVSIVLKNSLGLLGIETMEKM